LPAPAVGHTAMGPSPGGDPGGARRRALALRGHGAIPRPSRRRMNAVLIVPALNEAAVIGELIGRVPRGTVTEIMVVDNGSTDRTAAVAREAGARVVNEPRRGYGAACHAGVVALPHDAAIAVFMDGDGSQRPEEIPLVLAPILASQADFVLGAR